MLVFTRLIFYFKIYDFWIINLGNLILLGSSYGDIYLIRRMTSTGLVNVTADRLIRSSKSGVLGLLFNTGAKLIGNTYFKDLFTYL